MPKTLTELEHILNEELINFKDIYNLEKEKIDTITNRDGKRLQLLSENQDIHLKNIAILEGKRKEIIDNFKKEHNFHESYQITLKEIISTLEITDTKLLSLSERLRETLLKIKTTQELNEKLMNDNIKFFNILINELKDSITLKIGYKKDGMENPKRTSSVLLNRTA